MTRDKHRRRLAFVALVIAGCASRGPSSSSSAPGAGVEPAAAAEPVPVAAPHVTEAVERLVALMQGSFSSREQALADPEYFDIRLHMLPIWSDRDDGRWLYVEQAVAAAQAEPYRQRVYRVASREDGVIESGVYEIADPLRFALAWKDPHKLDTLRHEDLVRKDGCEVVLREVEPGRFVGATGHETCASDLRGARWATSEVEITADGVRSWDRGFDSEGAQVWGATKGGYVFRHDDPEAPPVAPPAGT
jgi:CpeT protein